MFVSRLLIPRGLGIFRRIIPFIIMLMLAVGNMLAICISLTLTTIMYNGRVAEAWRKAYFRSSASAAPPSAGPVSGTAGMQAAMGGGGGAHAQDAATNFGLGADAVGAAALGRRRGARPRKPHSGHVLVEAGSIQGWRPGQEVKEAH